MTDDTDTVCIRARDLTFLKCALMRAGHRNDQLFAILDDLVKRHIIATRVFTALADFITAQMGKPIEPAAEAPLAELETLLQKHGIAEAERQKLLQQ